MQCDALTEELNNSVCLAPVYTNGILPFIPRTYTCPKPFVLLRWYGTLLPHRNGTFQFLLPFTSQIPFVLLLYDG
jgi:hypothetical protein